MYISTKSMLIGTFDNFECIQMSGSEMLTLKKGRGEEEQEESEYEGNPNRHTLRWRLGSYRAPSLS